MISRGPDIGRKLTSFFLLSDIMVCSSWVFDFVSLVQYTLSLGFGYFVFPETRVFQFIRQRRGSAGTCSKQSAQRFFDIIGPCTIHSVNRIIGTERKRSWKKPNGKQCHTKLSRTNIKSMIWGGEGEGIAWSNFKRFCLSMQDLASSCYTKKLFA